MTKPPAPAKSHRPQAYTVFGAAIVAGAAAAFGLNSALDSHLAQARPQVESEAILVALRPLPAGAPVTVWDVGLRDWPKAMVPSTAMRVTDDLDNLVVRHPLREGQPILAVQLGRVDVAGESVTRPLALTAPPPPPVREPERDLWETPQTAPTAPITSVAAPPAPTVTTVSTTFATATTASAPPTVVAPAAPDRGSVSTTTPEPVTADRNEQAPPDGGPTLTVSTAPAPTGPITTTSERRPEQDPVAFPTIDGPTAPVAPPATVATDSLPLEDREPNGPRPPREAPGEASPPSMRTALRPRPSVVQALAVPDRAALSGGGSGTDAESTVPSRLAGRATSATAAVAAPSLAAPETAATPPRILPTGRDSGSTVPATTAPAARASQARSRATPPAPRSSRTQGVTKGYRPS